MWYSCSYDQDILKMFFKPSWLFTVAPHVKKTKFLECVPTIYTVSSGSSWHGGAFFETCLRAAEGLVYQRRIQWRWRRGQPAYVTPPVWADRCWCQDMPRVRDRLTALLKPKADIFSRICNLMQIKAESEWSCFIIRVLFYYSWSTVIQTVHPGCDGNLNWRWPIFGLR